MTGKVLLVVVLVLGLITELLRQMPFLMFSGDRKVPKVIEQLSPMLPPAIMATLVIYCLKDIVSGVNTSNIAMIIASIATALSYKWKKNSFLSLILGTVVNMVLLRIL